MISNRQKQIETLDKDILNLLKKRVLLYSEHLKTRQNKNLPFSDSEFEGKLWKMWAREIKGTGINQKILRNIYNYLNHLSYELAEKEDERTFKLKPLSRAKVKIDLPGPQDILLSRFSIFLAAITNAPIELEYVVLNDPLYELIKALNASDAEFFWDKEKVCREKGKELDFDKRAIFVGQDVLNLYLLIFAAISRPCICKLTGDTTLKIEDLRPFLNFLPQMGARIVPLIPGSYGLPIRIESTGSINDHIMVPSDIPDEALAALILSSLSYSLEKITISFPERSFQKPLFERLLYLLENIGINYVLQEHEISIYTQEVSEIKIGHILDPELTSYLLCIPLIMRGRAEITGNFIDKFSGANVYLKILNKKGEHIKITQDKIEVTAQGKRDEFFSCDIKEIGSALPLATALLFSYKNGGEIKGIPTEENESLTFVLEQLKIPFDLKGSGLYIKEGIEKHKGKTIEIHSPHPRWSVALSLFALQGMEIILENPGDITKFWPPFWTYYKSIPTIRQETKTEKEEIADVAQKSRRRILISGNKKIR